MEGVESVTQLDDTTCSWSAEIAGVDGSGTPRSPSRSRRAVAWAATVR